MTIQVTPSLAVTMLDALPYLIDYPYGCTEQTMSRFLPAAIAGSQCPSDEEPAAAQTLIENLENGVKRDERPLQSQLIRRSSRSSAGLPTAHWGEDGIHWRWSQGGVEATAFALRALLQISPDNELVDPVINWLIKNRRGAQWNSTRDTAIVALALNDYLEVSGELEQEVGYEVRVNGEKIAERHIAGGQLLSAPSRFAIDPLSRQSSVHWFRGPMPLNGEHSCSGVERMQCPAQRC